MVERAVNRQRAVIACDKREAFAQGSKATKQSILPLCRAMDCFASLAMTTLRAAANSRRTVTARDLFLLVELGPAPRQFFRTHLRDVVVVELPGRILAPAQRRLHRGAGAGRGFQQTQRQFERLCLRGDVLRLAGGVAERKIREQEA